MDFSGETRRALRPTLVAHADHTVPFFPHAKADQRLADATLADALALNASVQPIVLNMLVKAKRIGEILHLIHQTRDGMCTLLRRLASVILPT